MSMRSMSELIRLFYSGTGVGSYAVWHSKLTITEQEDPQPSAQLSIPFSYTQFTDGRVVIAATAALMDTAYEFAKTWRHDLFNAEAYRFVMDRITAPIAQTGRTATDNGLHSLIFGCWDAVNLPLGKIQDSTVLFDWDAGMATDYGVYKRPAIPGNNLYYATVIDGRLVSRVSCNWIFNEHQPRADMIDIGVSTDEAYRGNGYAVSNVVAISQHLLNEGYLVTYSCSNENEASRKTALSSGFAPVARRKVFAAPRT